MEAQEVPTDVCKHLMGVKKAEPGSSQRHRRKWAQAEVQEIPFTCQKMLLFYCKGGLSPEQAAQQGCEGATPGDVPNPTSKGPKHQLGLGGMVMCSYHTLSSASQGPAIGLVLKQTLVLTR